MDESLQVGDVVRLYGTPPTSMRGKQTTFMTVTLVGGAQPGNNEAEVAWLNGKGDLKRAKLPVAALKKM